MRENKTLYLNREVIDGNGRTGIIIHSGKDMNGLYSCVKYADGTTKNWHRSCLEHTKKALALKQDEESE